MVADGLTKGSVDRTVLASIMAGLFELRHDAHEYQEPTAGTMPTTGGPMGDGGGGDASAAELTDHPAPTPGMTTNTGGSSREGGGYGSAIDSTGHSNSC